MGWGRPAMAFTSQRLRSGSYGGSSRMQTFYGVRCLRCSWNHSPLSSSKREVRRAFSAHAREVHPDKTVRLRPTVRHSGHCINCSGARYVKRHDPRPLIDPQRPEEPTARVHDGLGDADRATWEDGNVAFEVTGFKQPEHPTCPRCGGALRPSSSELVALDGRPVGDFEVHAPLLGPI